LDKELFLTLFIEALRAIREPRYFNTERGYQGELLAELRNRIEAAKLPGDPIVEQEYQKTIPRHGLTIRPDIIIHIPFDRGVTESRRQGNFVAVELKRRADKRLAEDAFDNLRQIKEALDYPLTIFVNIDSSDTYAEICPGEISAQTACIAVRLEDGNPVVKVQGY
jgi:hypothetical protein